MATAATTAIYTRISRDATGEEAGVERQEKLCRELAGRMGIEEVVVYSDNDVGASSRTGNKPRPSYTAMLDAVRAGVISRIIAYSNSRLTRRPAEWMEPIALAESGALQIATVASGRYDLTTADGRAIAITVAAWDSAEAERISERQTVTFRDNALQGKVKRQRQRPFGWEDDAVTLREEEASLIREAVKKLKQGASVASIRDEWEAAGVRTAAGGERWEHGVLKRVLVGWRTAGVRTYRREPVRDAAGELVMGQWDPIISLEDREQALAMLHRRTRAKVRQGTWLLAGLVRCGECGGRMYGQLSGTPSYSCKAGRGHNAITAEKLENHVTTQIAFRVMNRLKGDTPAPVDATPPVWPHEDALVSLDKQIEELMDAYKAQALPGEVVFPQVKDLSDKRSALRSERDEFYASRAEPEDVYSTEQGIIEAVARDFVVLPDIRHDEQGNEHHEPDAEAAAKKLAMAQELDYVIVRKGKRGREGWGREAFLERVELVWRR